MPRNFREKIPDWVVLVAPVVMFFVLFLLLAAGAAHAAPEIDREVADLPPTARDLAYSADQFWVLCIGALTPLVTYLVNTYAPWVSEQVKGLAQVIAAALAAALFQLLEAGELALNAQTLQLCGSAVVAALFTHKFLWQPSGIALSLGAGTNRNLGTHR